LERLVEEVIVDAYGDSEQRTAFLTVLQDGLELPFETVVLDVPVTVEGVEMTSAEVPFAAAAGNDSLYRFSTCRCILRDQWERSGSRPTGVGHVGVDDRPTLRKAKAAVKRPCTPPAKGRGSENLWQ
jgi:hypothetical protein